MKKIPQISLTGKVGILLALFGTAHGAVTNLPVAPDGFQWQLFEADLVDSVVINTTSAEALIEADLEFSGSSTAPFSASGSSSQDFTLTAFGSPEPSSYNVGDFIDVVTSNSASASLSIFSSAGILNPDEDFIFVENALNGVQITSSVGDSLSGSDSTSATDDEGVILVNPNASASVSLNPNLSQVEGESLSFSFAASDSFTFNKPTGGSGTQALQYFVNPTVNLSLRRDTTYTTFRLITNAEAGGAVPEPSSVLLLALSGFALFIRRR